MTTPTNETNDLDLKPLEEQLEESTALVAPSYESIGQTLESLWQEGADESRLTVIQSKADQLVNVINSLNKAATMGLNTAQKALEQRDAAVSELEDLRDAVMCVDTDNDLVSELVDAVLEDEAEYIYQNFDENQIQNMVDATPLEWTDASFLQDVLFNTMLSDESPLWDEFKAWMIKARDEIKGNRNWYNVKFSFESKD
jgi:hypothetical protein